MGRLRLFVAVLLVAGCIDDGPIAELSLEVIGGEQTPEGIFPATGALVAYGQFSCTGTLISPTVVLTAGHCVDELFTGPEVPGFTLDHDATGAGLDVVDGQSVYQHPEFDLGADPQAGVGRWNDIGILTLAEPIEGVAYELLPSPEEAERELAPDVFVDIVGYGLTDQEAVAYGVKSHGQSTLVEVGTHELFLGKPGEQQNCNGDSGGPGFVAREGGRRVFGVVSRSPDDNPVCDHGGIHTRVDPYLDWILSVAPQLCDELDCSGDGAPKPKDPEPDPSDPSLPGTIDEGGGGCQVGSQGNGSGGGVALCMVIFAITLRRRRAIG